MYLFIYLFIQQNMIIKEGGMMFEIWRDLPLPIYMQIYMFDVLNPDEVLRGKKPYVKQKGPYTYKGMSAGDESDVFVTPNPVFWTLVESLQWQSAELRKILNFAIDVVKEKAFMKRTMRDIIWGYHDSGLTICKTFAPDWFYTDFIGYFINKNNTNDGVYTIYTGEKDITKLGFIDKYNGSRLKYVHVYGTCGAPYTIDRSTKLYAFASDVCRSAQGEYSGDIEGPGGITLWRYTAPYDYMANATVNPDNKGFCTPQKISSKADIVESSHYIIFLAYEHEVYQVIKRATANITPVFMPVFWINESAVIDPPRIELLKSKLFTPMTAILVIEISLISIGVVLLLSGLAYALYKRRRDTTVLKLFASDSHEQTEDQEPIVKED
ncbi:hypothetical protein KUTeg_019961 [Tegillarca granosa]|uniref:Uncharacterized protein n=1 Tax=Tegillarca granosa TaxID=220873 RepID=A0ABQ9EJ62_TEGGR|nr:hypothetical protein KUTeg_019961 [Tegillarca granosa]